MIKTAIIGCGNIGKRHVAVFDANPQTTIVGLCDEQIEKAQTLQENYGEDYPVTSQYEDILQQQGVDLVSICTPHYLHKDMTLSALRQGKHVLVEKPMALNVADSKEMIRVAKEVDRRLYVMKQNRFNVPITLTKEALDSGKLGKIYMVQCNVYWNRNPEYYSQSDWRGIRAKEGGALFTQASHFIDLLIWWFGDVVKAKGTVDTKMQQIEVEDCGNAIMEFSSGVQGAITWTTCVYNKNYEGSITIVGEKGTVKIGGAYLNKIDYWDVQSYPLPNNINFADLPNNYGKYQGTSSNHHKVVEEIVKDLQGKKSDIVEGEEGIKSIEAIEMIYNDATKN
jgi:predicted dehydrogenase